MNSFKGKIVSIDSSLALSYVTIEHQGDHFGVMLIDTVYTNFSLCVGHEVRFGFKEADVILLATHTHSSSLCAEAEVVKLERGDALSLVTLRWKDEVIKVISPSAMISWLSEGEKVYFTLSPSHIFLLKDAHGE